MSKNWETPRAVVEGFTANEYCYTCWGVKCDIDQSNAWEKEHGNTYGIEHREDYCGHPSNNYLRDLDDDTFADEMVERNTDGLGEIKCTIYTDDTYSVERAISEVKTGDTIYWMSFADDGRVWHHQGSTMGVYPGHPNRS